jgi:hypothetical protein
MITKKKLYYDRDKKKVVEADVVPSVSRSSLPGGGAYSEARPLLSVASGVPKHMTQELRDFVKERKLKGVEVLDTGEVQFTSRSGRKEYLKARGMIDNDGGYGDG